MSVNPKASQEGTFNGYSDLLAFYQRKSKECPKGVTLKLERNKYLLLQFIHPDTGKRSPKPCGVNFTEDGIIQAVSKAHKVRQALDTIKTASTFWEWYDKEILGKNEITNDLKTYQEIFETIEQRYWNGRNKNTKRKRSKDIPNDVATFNRYYGEVFKRFTNWDNHPNWTEIKAVLYSWNEGSKSFKDAYAVIKNVCNESANSEALLSHLNNIEFRQVDFVKKQSISLDEFLDWHNKTNSSHLSGRQVDFEAKQSWLWVASMCVVYGLRSTEVAASLNLTKPYTKDGVTIPALNDPNNKDLLLVLGDKTFFGVTIKTGGRICRPMTNDKRFIERLKITTPNLPSYVPKNGEAKSVTDGFGNNFRQRLAAYKCPVTQAYAFRHLANQLGEREGIPQEIRARSLGHSVSVNDSVYKKRSNLATSVDLLTNHSKQPLSLEGAKNALEGHGFDLQDKSVQAILKVIYQLEQ